MEASMMDNPTEQGMAPIHISANLAAGPNRRIFARSREHTIEMDVRKERGGDDAGPTPPECLAMALGGCVMNIARLIARENQMPLDDINLTISGDIDPSRAFGLDVISRAGFSDLSMTIEMRPALSDAAGERFRQELFSRCPLCDTIGNPTAVTIRLS
jgi:putative redox protein